MRGIFALMALVVLLACGSARALKLGNEEVPKERIIVFLLMGHSNLAGIDTRNSDGVTAPRIWNYQWFSDKQWVPAKETPGSFRNGLSTRGEGGPGMPFLKGMAQANPGYHFAVISNATLSCTLRGTNRGSNGSGFPADSARYWKGAKLYNEIVGAAKAVAADVTWGGVLCMLGTVEATRTSEEVCRAFSDDAVQMVTDLRADLAAPGLPFLMGEYEAGSTGDFSLNMPWPKIIDAQIKLIPSKLTHAATVSSVGIPMLDDHHYTVPGQGMWAQRAIALFRDRGWMPPPVTTIAFPAHGRAPGVLPAWEGMLPFRGAYFRLDGKREARRKALFSAPR